MKKFNYKKTLARIDNYLDSKFIKDHPSGKDKIFYHYDEWSGWRFYLKAVKHKDWRSIWGHLKNSKYLWSNNEAKN